MPGPEAWQSFAGVVLVLVFLGGAAVALRRLGILGAPAAKPAPAAPDSSCGSVKEDVTDRVHKLEREVDGLRLHVSENFVRRDDYITNESRVIGMLESHSATLARLEERIGGTDR